MWSLLQPIFIIMIGGRAEHSRIPTTDQRISIRRGSSTHTDANETPTHLAHRRRASFFLAAPRHASRRRIRLPSRVRPVAASASSTAAAAAAARWAGISRGRRRGHGDNKLGPGPVPRASVRPCLLVRSLPYVDAGVKSVGGLIRKGLMHFVVVVSPKASAPHDILAPITQTRYIAAPPVRNTERPLSAAHTPEEGRPGLRAAKCRHCRRCAAASRGGQADEPAHHSIHLR